MSSYSAEQAFNDATTYNDTEIPIIEAAFFTQVSQAIMLAAAQGFFQVFQEFPDNQQLISYCLAQLKSLGYVYVAQYDYNIDHISYGFQYPTPVKLGTKWRILWSA